MYLSLFIYVYIFYMKYLIQVSTKTITCILYDPFYFSKIINILQILQGVCKLLTLTVYFKKYLHVITSVINFYNYIYNYTVDPSSLTPTHTTKPVPPQQQQKCFAIQYEHNNYIVLIFWCKHTVVTAA